MKKILTACFITLIFFSACQKHGSNCDSNVLGDIKTSSAVITGRDLRKCACCWGWLIQIDNATYKFEKIPAGSPIDLDNLVYPATVNITWRNPQGTCGYPMIEIVSISQ